MAETPATGSDAITIRRKHTMDQDQFVEYVLGFYGPRGLYDMRASKLEVLEACFVRLTSAKNNNLPWEADSTDREIIRDIILERRVS